MKNRIPVSGTTRPRGLRLRDNKPDSRQECLITAAEQVAGSMALNQIAKLSYSFKQAFCCCSLASVRFSQRSQEVQTC